MATKEHEILRVVDVDPFEAEAISQITSATRQARDVGGYLHIEIRRAPEPVVEDRFWELTVTNPDISKAVGAPVSGLVDEVAGGLVAYVIGGQEYAQRLIEALNAAAQLNPDAQDGAGAVGRRIRDLTE